MHSHLEIIMPQVEDVSGAVNEVLSPFYENDTDNCHTFWDWWEIGGRWSGAKFEQSLDQDKLKAFNQWLMNAGVTVSGLLAGKQELSPATQIPMVDEKWREVMGVDGPCTLFKHSRQHSMDICPLSQAKSATANKVIIAARNSDGTMQAEYMVDDEYWNGVSRIKTVWDGTIAHAVTLANEKFSVYKDEYIARCTPTDDWLTVTVDYHS